MLQNRDSMNAAWIVGQQSSVRGIYYGWWTDVTVLCWFKTCSIKLTEKAEEEPHHRPAPAVEVGRNQQQSMSPPPPFACTKQSGGKGGSHGDSTSQRKGECQAEASTKNKPPEWGPALPARLNLFGKEEEGKSGRQGEISHLHVCGLFTNPLSKKD